MEITVRKPTEEEKNHLLTQPTWGSEVSRFDWQYDSKETCLLVQGEVTVHYGDKQVTIREGDLAVFPEGLSCVWEVTQPLEKHYILG